MIAEYFKENFPIRQLRYEMYLNHNKYLKIPELVFRFQDNVDLVAYDELKNVWSRFLVT